MTTTRKTTFLTLCLLLPFGDAVAQMGGDPAREIQEIAEAVDAQLKEIDRLLLESGKKAQERARPKQLLEDVIERNQTVDDGLKKLIEKLEEMKNQSSSSSSSGSQGEQQGQGQQGQDQQGQPQGGQNKPQGNRRENNNPEFEDQTGKGEGKGEQPQPGEQQPGEQQQPDPQGGKPQGGDASQAQGENVPGAPQDSPTGPGQRGEGEGQWGELQPYLNFLKNRGTSPKVPAKFRKYYEAYLKRKAGDKK